MDIRGALVCIGNINDAEKCRHGSVSSTQWNNIALGHKVMQGRKLLSDIGSK